MPACVYPVVAHGPFTSMAAWPDWISVSACAPESAGGEMWSLWMRLAQNCTACFEPALLSRTCLPSEERIPPLASHIRMGNTSMVLLVPNAMPYCFGLPSVPPGIVSFCASAAHSVQFVGGLAMPAALNIVLL